MLVEQAFFNLPEILLGSGYNYQEYEVGVVNALSLALLQTLNGRNINNPISCLQAERLYRTNGVYPNISDPRLFRADLFLNTSHIITGNKRLSLYGWRINYFLEAKFLRGQAKTKSDYKNASNKTANVPDFLSDLIRLAILPEEKLSKNSITGRYFLHIYDAPPKYYLPTKKREWLKKLTIEGEQNIQIKGLSSETDFVKKKLGNILDLELELNITNFRIAPVQDDSRNCYWFYLTRIDSIECNYSTNQFCLQKDRTYCYDDVTQYESIVSYVAQNLNISEKKSELIPPEEGENTIDEDENACA